MEEHSRPGDADDHTEISDQISHGAGIAESVFRDGTHDGTGVGRTEDTAADADQDECGEHYRKGRMFIDKHEHCKSEGGDDHADGGQNAGADSVGEGTAIGRCESHTKRDGRHQETGGGRFESPQVHKVEREEEDNGETACEIKEGGEAGQCEAVIFEEVEIDHRLRGFSFGGDEQPGEDNGADQQSGKCCNAPILILGEGKQKGDQGDGQSDCATEIEAGILLTFAFGDEFPCKKQGNYADGEVDQEYVSPAEVGSDYSAEDGPGGQSEGDGGSDPAQGFAAFLRRENSGDDGQAVGGDAGCTDSLQDAAEDQSGD